MNLLRSVAMAFSMFSRLPMPKVEWKEENMGYMLAAFPLVGCACGLALFLWTRLCAQLSIGPLLFAAGVTLIPVAVSGGVHLDGLADTADALASHASPEKKREILKDPHAGAFAVIAVAAYLLAFFALASELAREGEGAYAVCLIPVMSRALSGFVSLRARGSKDTGLLFTFRSAARKRAATAILCAWLLLSGGAAVILAPLAGAAMALAGILAAACCFFMAKRQFGGMSGDISGYLLECAELSMLAALVFIQKAVVIWS